MVTTLQIAGMSLTAVLLAKLLERYAAEQALMLTLLLGTVLTGAGVLALLPVLNQIDSLMGKAGLSPAETASIGKAIGICCVTQLASDVCKDAGASALASGVILTGKAALLLLILPLISPLLSLMQEVLSCVT
ncbi:MAG: stage III sporulation protein AD [Oscillospiraceae bacterium]|nr:stage III sporulation protein AD [Oscillospiraceae bacterium]